MKSLRTTPGGDTRPTGGKVSRRDFVRAGLFWIPTVSIFVPRLVLASRRRMLAGAAAPSTLNSGLVAYWKLDEASGTRNDSVGVNHLTDVNTVTQATGKVGSAAQFTAANLEYLNIASNTDVQMGNISFTFAAWVYLDSKPATQQCPIVSKWGATSQYSYLIDWYQVPDRFRMVISGDGTSPAAVSVVSDNFGAPSTSQWNLVIGWYDAAADSVNISVNAGTANSGSQSAGAFASTSPFRIGAKNDSVTSASFMGGRIDEVGFWKRVLTPGERTELYNGGTGKTYPF